MSRMFKLGLMLTAGIVMVGCSASSHSSRYAGGTSAYGADYAHASQGGSYYGTKSRYGNGAYGMQSYGYAEHCMEGMGKRSRYGEVGGYVENCVPNYMTYYQQQPIPYYQPQTTTATTSTYTPPATIECPSGSYLNSAGTSCIQSETTYTSTVDTSTTVSTDCPAGSSWSTQFSMCVQQETPSYTSTYTPPTTTYTPPVTADCPAGSYRSSDGMSCLEGTSTYTPSYPTPSLPPVDWTPLRK